MHDFAAALEAQHRALTEMVGLLEAALRARDAAAVREAPGRVQDLLAALLFRKLR